MCEDMRQVRYSSWIGISLLVLQEVVERVRVQELLRALTGRECVKTYGK